MSLQVVASRHRAMRNDQFMKITLEMFRNVMNYRSKKIPAGNCDSYTFMLRINPPDDWLKMG